MHRSDFGVFQQADVLGTNKIIYVKDEDAMYDKDPKQFEDAKAYGTLTLSELTANPPETNMIEASVFGSWQNARNIKTLQIVNGLKPGQLTAAIQGESVGTVITKD
jgi:molybdenum storage protein